MPSHTLDSTTESDEAEGGASQLLQRRARQASAMSTTASISRRLSFSTAHSNAVEVQRSSSDEESSASDDDDELGLGLTLPSKEHRSRRRTIVTPFSRPPSAVTSYSGPSRPSSAAPIDALRRINPSQASQRRPTPLATSSKLASLPSSPPTEAPSPPSPTRRLSRDGEQVLGSREAKGKGRAQEEHDIHGESSMMLDDPLDPLSSMLYRGASSASATEHEVARSKPGSARNGRDKVKSAQRKSIPPPPHEPPPASATSYPSSDSVASTSHVTLSSTGRSDPSSSNSTGASPASSTAPQPSLQQLLQTVDLSAALKLVQTLQSQQNQPPPITVAPPPPPPSEPSASHAAHQPASPAFAPFPPISPSSNALPPRQPLAFPPSTSVSHPLSPMPESPTPAAHFEGLAVPEEKEKKSDRRRSLSMSMGFGGGVAAVGKRLRTSSSASVGTMASQREGGGGLPRVKERVVGDERATMSEAARGFEGECLRPSGFCVLGLRLMSLVVAAEQISRVHLSLSPATLRRAQNCAKYLSLRYTPVYSALAAGVAPPNPVDVARWRQEKEEVERRIRRAKVGGSTSAVGRLGKINGAGVGASNGSRDDLGVSTDGEGAGARGRPSDASSVSSPLGVPVAAYGPRRNKYPKAWEVYPDEVAEYVAAGGKVEPADSGGAPLRAGISSLTRVSSTGSEHGGKTSSTYNSPAAPSSSAQWNGSPVLDSSPISVDRQYLGGNGNGGNGAHVRPDTSRENSYEGSPLARSGTSRTSASAELAGSSSLRHASSVNSGGAGGTLTPTLAASALSKNGEGALGIGNGYGSPRSRVASAHVSRDFLPSPTTTNGTAPTEPSSPRVVVNGHSPLLNGGQFHTSPSQSNALKLQSSSSTAQASGTSGVRSNISRRLDRIRGKMGNGGAGTEGETSDAGRGGASTPMARRDSADWASPDPSDGEHHPHHLSPGVTHPRSPYRSSLAQLSDQGPLSRRPKLRKNATSFDFGKGFDTDGYKSSGGEESGAGAGGRRRPSRGIFAAAWQGFKGSLDAYPGGEDAMGFGGAGGAAAARARAAARAGMGDAGGGLMRRRIVLDESDDEDVKVPREVLDLGDEEFAQLNR